MKTKSVLKVFLILTVLLSLSALGSYPAQAAKAAMPSATVTARLYFPDVRNAGTFVTYLHILNQGSAQTLYVDYYSSNGALYSTATIADVAEYEVADVTPPSGFSGAAIVRASYDVIGVTRQQETAFFGYASVSSYTAFEPSGTNLGWNLIGTTFYAPWVAKNYNSTSSTIRVMNVGTLTTSIYVYYYNLDGTLACNPSPTVLQPKGWGDFSYPTSCGTSFTGNVKIVSSGAPSMPIAVVVNQTQNGKAQYNALSAASSEINLPSIMKESDGWTSDFVVMNTSASAINVNVTYYPGDGSGPIYRITPIHLTAHGSQTLSQADEGLEVPWHGSAVLNVQGGSNSIAVIVNQRPGSAGLQSYSGQISGVPNIHAPYVAKGSVYDTVGEVMNLSASSNDISVTYYDDEGNPYPGVPIDCYALSKRTCLFPVSENLEVEPDFEGSAVYQGGSASVAGVESLYWKQTTLDYGASYNIPPQ